MTKRKTPFFFTFKGLLNSPIFQYLNFSFHRHFLFRFFASRPRDQSRGEETRNLVTWPQEEEVQRVTLLRSCVRIHIADTRLLRKGFLAFLL